jgi:hypothetical protein
VRLDFIVVMREVKIGKSRLGLIFYNIWLGRIKVEHYWIRSGYTIILRIFVRGLN